MSITWDECHKIYISMTQEAHDRLERMEYEMTKIGDVDAAVSQLHDWFESSCSLRFITAVDSTGDLVTDYRDVIAQFAYDDDED